MINVALLGFGRIGQMHAQNIYLNKTLNLLYVYEKIDKLRKKAKNLYNCKIEKDYKKIFSDEKVDIIFISSPTNTHIRFIEEGIKYNKTIFCEKPLDLNINKIVKTFKKVKKNNSKIQMGFNRRFDPSHHSIKKDLEKGKIGRLEKIIITRYYLNNDEILEISSSVSSFENFYKKIKDHELATVTMKSKKGVICVITNSRHCSFGYDQRVELFGKKGMLLSGNQKNTSTEIFNSSQSHSQKPFLNFFIERYKEAYNLQLNELISLHKNRIKPRSSFKDGYLALKIANAAYQSLKQKKVVKLK